MTRRERVIAALRHQRTDFVPYQADLLLETFEKMAAYTGDRNFLEKLGCHMYIGGYGRFTELQDSRFRDDFGVIWNREKDKDIGVVENLLIPDEKIDENGEYDYTFPDIDEEQIRRDIEGILQYGQDRFLGYGIGFSLFERAWTLRGMENLLCDMLVNPAFVHKLLNDICEFNEKIIAVINEYDGLDGIYFGDDWGQQKGLIMGETHWREFIKPYLRRMYRAAKAKGKFVLQHSCGDIEAVYPDLIELGLDVHNTFQPEIYDVEKVKREFGDRLSFWGGISTQRVLAHGTPREVRDQTIYMIRVMGKESGGYIVAPTHGVPRDVPCENLEAMFDVFVNQEKYI